MGLTFYRLSASSCTHYLPQLASFGCKLLLCVLILCYCHHRQVGQVGLRTGNGNRKWYNVLHCIDRMLLKESKRSVS
jgi:hypothetical protein